MRWGLSLYAMRCDRLCDGIAMGNGEPTSKRGGIAPVMAALADLKDRMTELEVGHRNPEGHEDLLECPECYGLVKRENYIKHTEKHKEKPRTILHPFAYGLGYCKNCNQVEARDLPQVIAHLPELIKYAKEKSDAGYKCRGCGLPIVDPKATERCPLCDHTQAIRVKPKS